MLIEIDGAMINLNHVQAIRPLPHAAGEPSRSELLFADGSKRTSFHALDWFERFAGTIIPAPPGYSVIDASPNTPGSPGPVWFNTTPVIAFRHTGSEGGPVAPITDEGEPSDSQPWVLLKPTGECASWDRFWPSAEAWKAEMIERMSTRGTVRAA